MKFILKCKELKIVKRIFKSTILKNLYSGFKTHYKANYKVIKTMWYLG